MHIHFIKSMHPSFNISNVQCDQFSSVANCSCVSDSLILYSLIRLNYIDLKWFEIECSSTLLNTRTARKGLRLIRNVKYWARFEYLWFLDGFMARRIYYFVPWSELIKRKSSGSEDGGPGRVWSAAYPAGPAAPPPARRPTNAPTEK